MKQKPNKFDVCRAAIEQIEGKGFTVAPLTEEDKKKLLETMFTKEEVEAAERKQNIIALLGSDNQKACYMAGEICMWKELRDKFAPQKNEALTELESKLLNALQELATAFEETIDFEYSCKPSAEEYKKALLIINRVITTKTNKP